MNFKLYVNLSMETNESNKVNYLSQSLSATKTGITKLLDTTDRMDRYLYGKRMKIFVWGCILVLAVAPLLDNLLKIRHERITYFSTFGFLLFILIVTLAFIGSWRDEDGNWTWARAKSRLNAYYGMLQDAAQTGKVSSGEDNLYKTGVFLLVGGIAWKAFHNLSIFVRKPLESLLGTRLSSFRHFEKYAVQYSWIPILTGLAVLAYLYKRNPQILARIQQELRVLFGWKTTLKYTSGSAKDFARSWPEDQRVFNTKMDNHVQTIIAGSPSDLLTDLTKALSHWNPKGAYYEYEFQDRLFRHLRKCMPEATVETEYPIGDSGHGNRGRADMVINDTILIEMKRDSRAGAIQRAKGQMMQYSEIWQNKGPVILLLCDYEYEHAKLAYASTMSDLAKLQRPAITLVAKPA